MTASLSDQPPLTHQASMTRIVRVDPRLTMWLGVFFVLCTGLLLAWLVSAYLRMESDNERALTQADNERTLRLSALAISESLGGLLSDLRFISRHNEIDTLLRTGTGTAARALAREYATMLRQKRDYDQIRFIDLHGMERVRVDQTPEDVAITPDAQLQDKSGRYYYTALTKLRGTEIYVSPMDLNIEHGQFSQPLKPMLRVGMAVDSPDDARRGYVMINYLAERLLAKLRKVAGDDHVIGLLDHSGEWLLGPTAESSWSGQLPERRRHGFATKYPAAWEQLRREMSGSVTIAGKDYQYMRVYPLRSIAEPDSRLPLAKPAAPDGYYWYMIVAPRQLPATVNQARHVGMTYMGGGAVGLLLLVLSFALAYAIARQHALSMALGRAVDNLPVLIAYIDNGQRFRFNNRAYLDVYGIAPRELYGKQLADVVGAEAYAKLQPHLEQALAGEQAECELHIEMGARQLDLALTLVPDLTGGGHVRGIYAQATDITQRKASEQREREHLLELAKVSRMASVGEITSEIAHQVNQPLAAIAMFSNAAQRTLEKGGEPGQLRDWMVTINAQAKRASDIIQRMRRFARREDMQSTALDLNETVREVVGLLEPVARARQVEVRLDLADSVPPVLASAALMEQVIYHLLRNAIRSAEGAAPAGLVTVRSRADATRVSVEVCNRAPASDRSPDMPDFDTLQGHQADTACADLSTSREIVGGLQGELYCLCTPEGGSQIYFTLPIMEP